MNDGLATTSTDTEEKSMARSRRPRRPAKPFRIIFRYGQDEYQVSAMGVDPADARKAFRLCKQTGDRHAYEVHVTATGPRCGCKGFRFRAKCKHLFMLRKARMLD